MNTMPTSEQQLKILLDKMLKELEKKYADTNDKQLVIAIAKDMIKEQTFTLKQEPRHLLHDNKDAFQKMLEKHIENTLTAAKSASIFLINRADHEKKLTTLILKYETLKNQKSPSEETKKELKETREQIKKILKFYNKFEPNPLTKKKIEELLKDGNQNQLDDLLNKLAKKVNARQRNKQPPASTENTETENKELANTLFNLFGMDPTKPGRICGPVLCIVGDMMGIPDATPAFGFSPIHLESGDLDMQGRDEHAEVENLVINLSDETKELAMSASKENHAEETLEDHVEISHDLKETVKKTADETCENPPSLTTPRLEK